MSSGDTPSVPSVSDVNGLSVEVTPISCATSITFCGPAAARAALRTSGLFGSAPRATMRRTNAQLIELVIAVFATS